MRLGRSDRRCIAGGEVFVDLLADCFDLTLSELADADAAPAFGSTDQCRIHQLQDGAFTKGMRDHLGAPPLLAKQPLQEIGGLGLHPHSSVGVTTNLLLRNQLKHHFLIRVLV